MNSPTQQAVSMMDKLLDSNAYWWILLVIMVVLIVMINVLGTTITRLARERTRREIAAYIAEGSMTPEQGERLLKAGKKSDEC